MPPSDLPSKCVCHAPSRKMGGFVAQRHDGVRNLLTSLIGEVCTNVKSNHNYNLSIISDSTSEAR